MKKILLSLVGIAVIAVSIFAFILTRDGELKTPTGNGTIDLAMGTFEAFPLPDYAAEFIDEDYKSYLVEVEPGIKIHVLEVGSGYPVYMQHGAPTSGFLYRKVANELPRDQFRIIMPTMVGLGFSSKVPASQHTLDNHTRWMNEALNQLALDELIYMGHDWGGPVGMGALVRSPELLKGAVILNTVFTVPTEKGTLPTPLKVIKTPVIGEFLLEGLTSSFNQMPGVQVDSDSISADVLELYERPVRDSGNTKGPLAILRMAADGPDHPTATQLKGIVDYIQSLEVPTAIVWGMNDPILGTRLPEMINHFPEADVTETGAGHFLQEEGDGPEAIADAIQRVHGQIQNDKDN
ncbi:MAG: alpha/beta fold hydrolase [Pseudomonadota bacterium]